MAKQLALGSTFGVAWRSENCSSHAFGKLPGRAEVVFIACNDQLASERSRGFWAMWDKRVPNYLFDRLIGLCPSSFLRTIPGRRSSTITIKTTRTKVLRV